MKTARGKWILLVPALALGAAAAWADDPTTISQHGDALARATSAQALVQPMPAYPPNTRPLTSSSQAPAHLPAPVPVSAALTPAPRAPALTQAPPASGPRGVASAAPAPTDPPADAPAGPGALNKTALIALGVLASLGMFLWERRKIRGP